MSLCEIAIIVLFLLFIVNQILYFVIAPNRLAKAKPYKVYGHGGYGPDKNGFNCAIVTVSKDGKNYYRISWKAANGFWQSDYKPLPGMKKVILFKRKIDAILFIQETNGLLLERDDFYKMIRQKENSVYEVKE